VNLSQHPLRLVAKENWNDSLLHRLMHSERATPNANRLIHRFIVGYVGTVILLAIAGLLHALNSGAPVESALQIAISVLVVSCPCATGVALPLIHEIAAQRLRTQGVFIRDSSLWRRLLRVRRIAFDKTGTLTSETLRLASATTLTNLHPTALQALKILVAESLHPVATAIRSAIGDPIAPQRDCERASELIGLGLEWHDSTGTVWRLGKPVWAVRQSSSTESRNEQGTVLSRNFLPVAAFHCDETLRSDAVEEIRHLSAAGIQCYILSGDEPPRVERIAKMLSLPPEAAQGNLSPDSKAQWLRNARAREDTLMLGDGANDALAFNESLCCGTPAVDRGLLEQRCDFYLLGRGLQGVRALLEMARKQEIITQRVLVFAGLYNLAVIGLSLTGRMHPLLASLLMPASSIATLGIVLVAFGHAKSSKMSGGSAKMPRETRTQA
jgi:Cu2+-exporting ATPase